MVQKFSKREKIIFGICLTLIFVYVGYYKIYRLLNENRIELENKIESKGRKLKKDLLMIKRGKATRKDYEKILEKFSQQSSDEKALSSILLEIEQVADESQMRIAEMKPQKVKKVDFFNNFSVSLVVDGTLKEILKFLYILQNDPYLYDVDEIRFDKVSPRIPKLKCRLVISKILIP